MATRLKFPRGSTVYFLLSWTRDGVQLDLTGAELEALIKATALTPDAAAIALTSDDDPTLSFTWREDAAGLAILKFSPEATADWASPVPPFWRAKATLPNGDVIVADAHQGPVLLTPLLGSSLDAAWGEEPPVAGVTQTLEPGGTVSLLPPAMANYVHNRYDLTGLIGGTSVKLDGLSAATLALLQNGAKICLSFAGDIEMLYKLRAKGADVEDSPWVIVCDNDTTRCWELCSVTKQGVPAVWNGTTEKFHQVSASGAANAVAMDVEQIGFVLPA
jgi:hypothetical protein